MSIKALQSDAFPLRGLGMLSILFPNHFATSRGVTLVVSALLALELN